jgi:hypothetical protein
MKGFDSTRSRIAAAGVLLALMAMTSCGSSTPTAQDLMGMWASVPTVTQRGTTSETFCFAGDGSLEWTTRTPAGASNHRGTYKLAGNVLTIETPDLDAPQTLTASMSLGKLELKSPKGSTQKYSRVPGTCDVKAK